MRLFNAERWQGRGMNTLHSCFSDSNNKTVKIGKSMGHFQRRSRWVLKSSTGLVNTSKCILGNSHKNSRDIWNQLPHNADFTFTGQRGNLNLTPALVSNSNSDQSVERISRYLDTTTAACRQVRFCVWLVWCSVKYTTLANLLELWSASNPLRPWCMH